MDASLVPTATQVLRHVIPPNAVIGCDTCLVNICQHVWKPAVIACMNCSALHAIIARETTALHKSAH